MEITFVRETPSYIIFIYLFKKKPFLGGLIQ